MLPHLMKLNIEQRRALEMLADSEPRGCAEAVLRAHGFDVAILAELVDAGLAIRTSERVLASGRLLDVTRYKITNAGRKALV